MGGWCKRKQEVSVYLLNTCKNEPVLRLRKLAYDRIQMMIR